MMGISYNGALQSIITFYSSRHPLQQALTGSGSGAPRCAGGSGTMLPAACPADAGVRGPEMISLVQHLVPDAEGGVQHVSYKV
jgi:hypothetical protein